MDIITLAQPIPLAINFFEFTILSSYIVAGPSDSGFLRYMLSTAGPLAFIGGCQRAHIDLGTRTLAGTDESVGPAVDNV